MKKLEINEKKVTKERFLDNEKFRVLNSWKEGETTKTSPPTLTVGQQFSDGKFPQGEIQEYLHNHSFRS